MNAEKRLTAALFSDLCASPDPAGISSPKRAQSGFLGCQQKTLRHGHGGWAPPEEGWRRDPRQEPRRAGRRARVKLEWAVQEELKDIFSVFVMEGAGAEEQDKLQAALGLDDAVCAELKEVVGAGKFQLKADVADEALF